MFKELALVTDKQTEQLFQNRPELNQDCFI